MTDTALPRVLCVDDEPNVLAAMERNLFGEFDVMVALSGEAGLAAIARGERFAVIMSDMRMPGMDGRPGILYRGHQQGQNIPLPLQTLSQGGTGLGS
jgi:CheY-like chemotaxis protein